MKLIFLILSLFISSTIVAAPESSMDRITIAAEDLLDDSVTLLRQVSTQDSKILIFVQTNGKAICFAFIHVPSRTSSVACEGTTRQKILENIDID